MREFVKKIFPFAAIVLLFIIIINNMYNLLNNEDIDDLKKFNNVPFNIQICNFGSSHGNKSFNYEDVVNKQCFNFALTSQTLSYDYRLLKYYKDHISKGARIFITISYFSFFGNDESLDENFFSKNKRYYTILPKEYIKDYDLKTSFYSHFPSLTAGIKIFKVFSGNANETFDNDWKRKSIDIDIDKDSEEAYKRHFINNKLDENGELIINYEEIDALNCIIKLCKENEFIPVLITTPFLRNYTNYIKTNNPQFFDLFYSIINDISEKNNVMYIDYGFDVRFLDNYDLFMNCDHLNKEGARIFTNTVCADLKVFQ